MNNFLVYVVLGLGLNQYPVMKACDETCFEQRVPGSDESGLLDVLSKAIRSRELELPKRKLDSMSFVDYGFDFKADIGKVSKGYSNMGFKRNVFPSSGRVGRVSQKPCKSVYVGRHSPLNHCDRK